MGPQSVVQPASLSATSSDLSAGAMAVPPQSHKSRVPTGCTISLRTNQAAIA